MTNTEIENILYGWINGLLGMDAIFAYPSAPRPTTSYVLINFISNIELGEPDTKSVAGALETSDNTYSTPTSITVSVNTYYDGAYQKAVDIINSLMKLEVTEYLSISGLGFLSSTQIQKLPEEINQTWEERAQFDIDFFVRREVTENIEAIKKIEVNNITIGE